MASAGTASAATSSGSWAGPPEGRRCRDQGAERGAEVVGGAHGREGARAQIAIGPVGDQRVAGTARSPLPTRSPMRQATIHSGQAREHADRDQRTHHGVGGVAGAHPQPPPAGASLRRPVTILRTLAVARRRPP